jgi:hypothetical protein
MMQPNFSNSYHLHGLRATITANNPQVLNAVHSRLRQFATVAHSIHDLRFEYLCISCREEHIFDQLPRNVRPIYEPPSGEVAYSDHDDCLYITYGDGIRVRCDPKQGHAKISILESALENLWFISHPLFTLPFVESMKRHGRYSVHAAGLALHGRGLLLPAHSGSGKSTLALALLRAGYGFLGDDTLFLARDGESLRVCAFPDEIDATETTLAMFSELHHLLDQPKIPGASKRQIWAEEVYGIDFVSECQPWVLVFPKFANVQKSSIEPMSKDKALLEMASNILLTEARSSQAHLDALAELVKNTQCYHLQTGRDFDDLPRLLSSLLE